jgi:hypothetical protein
MRASRDSRRDSSPPAHGASEAEITRGKEKLREKEKLTGLVHGEKGSEPAGSDKEARKKWSSSPIPRGKERMGAKAALFQAHLKKGLVSLLPCAIFIFSS